MVAWSCEVAAFATLSAFAFPICAPFAPFLSSSYTCARIYSRVREFLRPNVKSADLACLTVIWLQRFEDNARNAD